MTSDEAHSTHGSGARPDSAKADRLMRELDAVEARLDPGPVRRGRLLADLATVAILGPVAFVLDWHASRPLLLLALMAVGIGLNRLVPRLLTRSLRHRRESLLEEYERIAAETVASDDGPRVEPG